MQQPLISILIPFKNTADFIGDCLQSIVEQSYQNWEVWAIDDHSSDTSLDIVKRFLKKDTRIKTLPNKGNGIIQALQTAYTNSKGAFITRMDSDDLMAVNKLTVLAQSLIEKGRGHLAVGQVKYFSESGISNGYARYEKWLNQLTETGSNYNEIYKECVIPSPSWMVHRTDLDQCNAFDSDRYPEDYDLTFRFYQAGLRCIPCSEVVHFWRDYNTRTSRTSEHYAQNYFLDIKLYYFLKLHHNFERPLVVWGAGTKGKKVAKTLLDHKIDFYWVCDNSRKIGKDIYGKQMLHYSAFEQLKKPQIIVTVANEEDQAMIVTYLKQAKFSAMTDYFLFC